MRDSDHLSASVLRIERRAFQTRIAEVDQPAFSLGITDSGALRVRQGERERAFHSGEVSLRPA